MQYKCLRDEGLPLVAVLLDLLNLFLEAVGFHDVKWEFRDHEWSLMMHHPPHIEASQSRPSRSLLLILIVVHYYRPLGLERRLGMYSSLRSLTCSKELVSFDFCGQQQSAFYSRRDFVRRPFLLRILTR